jgi:iron complex transport system ATP-binding protein
MSPAALEIRDLKVHGAGRCLLEITHCRLEPGSVLGLLGPNGAGKTTLLRAALGLTTIPAGTVRVLGEDMGASRGAARARLRRRIGYVPQLLPVHGELPLTVREVVAIGPTARAGWFQRLTDEDWRTVDHWLDQLGLTALADRAFSEISGGEQRKTIIARAMAQTPELLLLDEPTANLDLGWRERIVETIHSLYTQTRLSVVLVCHELEVLPASCHQVVLLDQGRVAARGTPESVFTSERVSQLFGADLQAVHQGGRHAVMPAGGTRA